jgi:hypothetical protein
MYALPCLQSSAGVNFGPAHLLTRYHSHYVCIFAGFSFILWVKGPQIILLQDRHSIMLHATQTPALSTADHDKIL